MANYLLPNVQLAIKPVIFLYFLFFEIMIVIMIVMIVIRSFSLYIKLFYQNVLKNKIVTDKCIEVGELKWVYFKKIIFQLLF